MLFVLHGVSQFTVFIFLNHNVVFYHSSPVLDGLRYLLRASVCIQDIEGRLRLWRDSILDMPFQPRTKSGIVISDSSKHA